MCEVVGRVENKQIQLCTWSSLEVGRYSMHAQQEINHVRPFAYDFNTLYDVDRELKAGREIDYAHAHV